MIFSYPTQSLLVDVRCRGDLLIEEIMVSESSLPNYPQCKDAKRRNCS